MDADTKVKELEEEFKILKAEIKNVLLDIREVILENNNPLGDDHQGAFIRMDLNTTAQALAAGEMAHEAAKASGQDGRPGEPAAAPPPDHPGVKTISAAELENADAEDDSPETAPEVTSESPAEPEAEPTSADGPETPDAEEPAPRVVKRNYRENAMPELEDNPTMEIPPMYRASPHSLDMTPLLSEWLSDALAGVGSRELERIIAIERLWGNLPPNISRALAYLQDLLRETADDDAEPAWLRLMRDLDRLSAI